MLTRPALLLRIEETVILAASLIAYQYLHQSWLLLNPRVGAATYNFAHTLTIPVTLLVAGYLLHWHPAPPLAIIWVAHIAFDRLLGYGLKYPPSFKGTHIQEIP
jgi:hypothetical protein